MKNSLNDFPAGNAVYVDSNIFIYDTTGHSKYALIRLVKEDPSLLDTLDIPFIVAENIMDMNMEIVSFSDLIFTDALKFMKQHHLMSNDAVHLATMKKHRVTDIATNDSDFERVEWLKVWKP